MRRAQQRQLDAQGDLQLGGSRRCWRPRTARAAGPRSAVKMTTMLKPTTPHTATLATEKNTVCEPKKFDRLVAADRAGRRQVQEAPQQRGDHARHRVRQEDRQPGEPRPAGPAAVQHSANSSAKPTVAGTPMQRHQQHPPDARPELRVGQSAGRSCPSRRRPLRCRRPEQAAADLSLLEAQIERVAAGSHHEQHEQRDCREDQQVRAAAVCAGRLRGVPPQLGHGEAALLHVATVAFCMLVQRRGERASLFCSAAAEVVGVAAEGHGHVRAPHGEAARRSAPPA